jgi:hypothetical protein
MFGFKFAKSEAFTDVLEQISSRDPDVEDGELEAKISPAQLHQSNDWLLQMLSGMMPIDEKGDRSRRDDYEATYLDLEDAVAPLLEAIVDCEQDAIAEELGLHANLSISELQKLRRAFARDNHPDRLAPAQRELATHRMTIANMLIDRELRNRNAGK